MTREFAMIFMILMAVWSLIVFIWIATSKDIFAFLSSNNFVYMIVGYVIILLLYPVGKAIFGDEYD